jgi:hypothetical protein
LEAEIVSAPDGILAKLATHGFEPPTELEGWEALARMVEQEPYLLTLEEIYLWAIAWSQREILRRRIVRGELRVQTSSEEPAKTPTDECPPGDAAAHRGQYDPRIAWWPGKCIYLGGDTQRSRR